MRALLPAFGLAARLLLFAVFVAAGVAKLRDRDRFRRSLEQFGAPPRLIPGLAAGLPILELLVAGALLVEPAAVPAAWVALALLLGFTAVLARSLLQGRRPSCQCFGELSDEPIDWSSIARNAAFLALCALVPLAAAQAGHASLVEGAALLAAPASRSPGLLGMLGLGLALLAGQTWILLFLVGRERGLARRIAALEARPAAPLPGLPVGAPAPRFTAPVLKGGREGLADLLKPGKPVFLFFFDPDCGPCQSVFPSLAKWQVEHADRLRFVLVGRSMSKKPAWPEYEPYHVLCQEDREVAQLFKVPGIPTALLIGPDGRIRSPLAIGPEPIDRLLKTTVGQAPPA